MADLGKVNYTVSMRPITILEAEDGQNLATEVINTDIGKELSSRADVEVDTAAHTTVGYASGVVAYLDAANGSKTRLYTDGEDGGENTAYDFVYIKHTGFSYGTPTTVGSTVISIDLTVYIEVTNGSEWVTLCSIPPGGAICLPNFPAQGANLGILVQPASGSDRVAVEYALIT